ncbi:AAEL017311-PA [Aedes aegypti]|uniref:AAEL017311-PA n=1 Tax=Aedes aegypti TaxID=7159 RepID=J9HG89_AEDAE|nr:AAEL017311-PA [Aedes aegypti]
MAAVFTINGKLYKVTSDDLPVDTSLNTFIRNYAHLTGTKFMCLEGGCGACIVNVKRPHPVTKKIQSFSVNSCLFSVFSCHGMEIVTIEGLGSKENGYHPVQKRLAHFNGTQCGFCSPGMVMSMYSLMDSKREDVTMSEIENSLDGNICRCTGYRPILDAFKSFACDANERLVTMCSDIEDLGTSCRVMRSENSAPCSSGNDRNEGPLKLLFKDGKHWRKVYSIEDILDIFSEIGNEPYIIVGGNTGHGVYRRKSDLSIFIDISSVEELHSHWIGSELIVGANVPLTEFRNILLQAASNSSKFKYCEEVAKHVEMIAHTAVRNVGSLAGNLSLKQQHHEFPSDLYLLLETVGAHLTITSSDGMMIKTTPQELIKMDMNKKIITNIVLPALDSVQYIFKSYKVQPRAQNAKAYVNAAFLVKLSSNKHIVNEATLCFGGIHPSFTHAAETERALVGKYLFQNDTIQEALRMLDAEINPNWELPEPHPSFRKQAALGLFYRLVWFRWNDVKKRLSCF